MPLHRRLLAGWMLGAAALLVFTGFARGCRRTEYKYKADEFDLTPYSKIDQNRLLISRQAHFSGACWEVVTETTCEKNNDCGDAAWCRFDVCGSDSKCVETHCKLRNTIAWSEKTCLDINHKNKRYSCGIPQVENEKRKSSEEDCETYQSTGWCNGPYKWCDTGTWEVSGRGRGVSSFGRICFKCVCTLINAGDAEGKAELLKKANLPGDWSYTNVDTTGNNSTSLKL